MLAKVKTFLAYIRSNLIEFLISVLFAVAILALLRLNMKTQIDDNWEQFKREHNCNLIESKGGNNIRTGWICDDGEEYYRWRQQR